MINRGTVEWYRKFIFISFISFLFLYFFVSPNAVSAFDVLPGNPVTIQQDPNRKQYSAVAANGNKYLCVWEGETNTKGKDIFGRFVSNEGSLQNNIIGISSFANNQERPDVGSNGENFLVVWADNRGSQSDPNQGYDIYGAIVSNEGIAGALFEIEKDAGDQTFPKVKWNGGNYLVVWENWSGESLSLKKAVLEAKRIDPNGTIVDQEPFTIDRDWAYTKGDKACYDIAAMSDSNIPYWFVAWNGKIEEDTDKPYLVLGKFIDDDPNHTTSNPFQISTGFYSSMCHPSTDGIKNNFLVVWETRELWGEDQYLSLIQGAVYSRDLGLVNAIYISSSEYMQQYPEVANNGKGYFVTWSDERDKPGTSLIRVYQVYGARVAPTGFPLKDPNSPNGTKISTDPNQSAYYPGVASPGGTDDRYLCLWSAKKGSQWYLMEMLYDPPPPPLLAWVGTGDYSADGVDPDSDDGGEPFSFKVKYISDSEVNEPPQIAQVWVDLNGDGRLAQTEIFTLEGEGDDPDYIQGRIYSYTIDKVLYDGDGKLAYSFLFMDKYSVAEGDPISPHPFTVMKKDDQPTLAWTEEPGFTGDGARPDGIEWGDEASVQFRVFYTDKDDDPPENIDLWLDVNGDSSFDPNQEVFPMTALLEDYATGAVFTASRPIKINRIATILYKVECDDGKNKAVGPPRSGSYLSSNPLGETSVCLNYPVQFSPALVGTPRGYQTFWEDRRDADPNGQIISHIWMELLSSKGVVKDAPSELGQSQIDKGQMGAFKPKANYDSQSRKTLAIWEDLRTGTVLEYKEGNNTFKPEAYYKGLDIYGAFLDPNGSISETLFGDEFIIAGEETTQNMLNADVALGKDGKFLAVWEDETRIDRGRKTDISALFIKYPEGPYGEKIDLGIDYWGRNPDDIGLGHQLFPKVAWNGQCYMVVWQDILSANDKDGFTYSRIYGISVDPNGDLSPAGIGYPFFLTDPNTIYEEQGLNQLFPDIASDGTNFLIVWQENRSDINSTGTGYDIYGIRVNGNGTPLDINKVIPICTAEGHQIRPKAFWDPQGQQYLIAWVEVTSPLLPTDMLYHHIPPLPYPRTGNIKVVRMSSGGTLVDAPASSVKYKYEGTQITGVSGTQELFDMVCDPATGCRMVWEDLRSGYSYDLYTSAFQSTLNWTADPNFSFGANPVSVKLGDTISFQIEYRDRLDLDPNSAQVWIDLDDDGLFDPNERFDMECDTNDPVSQGRVYTYSREVDLPSGVTDGIIQYQFRFETEEGVVNGIGSNPYTLTLQLPEPTEPPVLDWTDREGFRTDGVNPNSGESGDKFTFSVTYMDINNIKPQSVELWIDLNDDQTMDYDELFSLEEEDTGDTDYIDGKVYVYERNIAYNGDGMIRYKFGATNGYTLATGAPTSDNLYVIISEPKVEPKWTTFYKSNGLSGNYISSLELDQDNNLWVGTWMETNQSQDYSIVVDPNTGGLTKYDGNIWQIIRGEAYLPSNNVLKQTITSDNHLWVACLGGISRFNGSDWKKFSKDPNSIINSMASYNNDVWIGIDPYRDANTGEFSEGKLEKYSSEDDQRVATYLAKSLLEGNKITGLTIDKEGRIWAGIVDTVLDPNSKIMIEYKGIVVFDPNQEKIVNRFDSNSVDYPGGDWITAIYADKTGDIWVGSIEVDKANNTFKEAGLSRYSYTDKKWTQYVNGTNGVVLANNLITAIYRKENDLWLGHNPEFSQGSTDQQRSSGATLLKISGNQWSPFLVEDLEGQVSDTFRVINDIVVSDNDIVWFATQNGLVRYNPAGTTVITDDEVLEPYKGLFGRDEETGCFVEMTGGDTPLWANPLVRFPFLFALLIGLMYLIASFVMGAKRGFHGL